MHKGIGDDAEADSDIVRYTSFLSRIRDDARLAHEVLSRQERDLKAVDSLYEDLDDLLKVHGSHCSMMLV